MAGIFDTLTNAFTGAPAQQANLQTQQYIGNQQALINSAIQNAQTTGLGALQGGTASAIGALQPGITQARSDISGATPQAIGALNQWTGLGQSALQQGQMGGLAALGAGVNQAVGAFNPLSGAANQYGMAGQQASQASADALGLNGPEGVARAQATFQAGPGYQFGLNQGLESLVRNANVGGMAAGGNALRESQKFGADYANQEFDKYRQLLAGREQLYNPLQASALGQAGQGISQAALTGGTGGANIYTGTGGRLSDLYSTTGGREGAIYGAEGQSLADLASKGALAGAQIYQTGGQNQADLLRGLVGTQAGFAGQTLAPIAQGNMDAAKAQAAGSANLVNLLGSGATALATGGLSGGLGGLTSMFGGGSVGSPTIPTAPAPNNSYWAYNGMGGYSPTY
jgi:hypothetical protein